MIVEFHLPEEKIKYWVINDIKEKLIAIPDLYKEIYHTQVFFHKNPTAFNGVYECEIELSIFCNSILLQYTSDNYYKAALKVIKDIPKKS